MSSNIKKSQDISNFLHAFLALNTLFALYLCLRHQLQVNEIRFLHCFNVRIRTLNPTDLAIKQDSNRFNIIQDIVRKRWRAAIWRDRAPRSQSLQMHCGWNEHRSQSAQVHRTLSGTWGLAHKLSLHSTFQRCLRKLANLGRLHCTVYVPTHVPISVLSADIRVAKPAPAPNRQNETQDFS